MRRSQKHVVSQLLWLALAGEAEAHDWYSDKSDPVFHSKCCGGDDCHVLGPENVRPAKGGGYFVRQPFRFWTDAPGREWFIPKERVQIAPDERYHICEALVPIRHSYSGTTARYKLRWTCFFAPTGTS